MNGTRTLIITIVFLFAAIFAAGCVSPSTPAPVQTQPPTTIVPTSLPPTVTTTPAEYDCFICYNNYRNIDASHDKHRKRNPA